MATPARRIRDPNDIFASLDSRPSSPGPSSPTRTNEDASPKPLPRARAPPAPQSSSTAPKRPPIQTSRRVLSISKRFMGSTGSILRRNNHSPPRGRRSPPPSKRRVSGKGGIKPPLDLGPQLGPHDNANVRERIRKWQATGGGVIDPEANTYVPPAPLNTRERSGSVGPVDRTKSPEKRRTMLADYGTSGDFEELETSSARWGHEPLALPAPPALFGNGRASRRGSVANSAAGSTFSGRDGGVALTDWEDAASGAEMSGREDRWVSGAEDKIKPSITGTKKKKKRVPRDVDAEDIRARKNRRKKKFSAPASRVGSEVGTDGEGFTEKAATARSPVRSRPEPEPEPEPEPDMEPEVVEPDDVRDDMMVVPVSTIDAAPPPPPPMHSVGLGLATPLALKNKLSTKSLGDTPTGLKTKPSVKSLDDTPASIKSAPSREGTPVSSLLDDDGIRVAAIRRKFTKSEKKEIHKQRQAEREEMRQREIARIREEEKQKFERLERLREEEREREIERIKEDERQKVLAEERAREEERRKIREMDLKMQREREEQKRRDRDREERKRQRELIREQERQRQIERIKEEEKLKVIEEIRQEQERAMQEIERERQILEEKRLMDQEEERHREIMWEIELENQRTANRARKKRKDKDDALAEEVQKRVGPDALRSKEEMTDAIKQAVREVMGEMFGEIIIEDEGKSRSSNERSNISSSLPTDVTSSEQEAPGNRTRDTTPEVEKKPSLPILNDITFRAAEFKKTPEPSIVEETPPEPPSPETPTKSPTLSLPKRRLGLFGSPTKRRRKPFQSTIPEESASQLSINEPETKSPPGGTRKFSFMPEPISLPSRKTSAASSHAPDPASPPSRKASLIRRLSIVSRSSHHTDYSDHSTSTVSQIHPNLPVDEILSLPGEAKFSLTRSLTSPASHTHLAKEESEDEYFVSVHEPLVGSGIKRYKSTADLISILSERRPSSARPKSIRSVRSVKNKKVIETLTLTDLLTELATEEVSYTQDLNLLEYRIIPVLLDAKLTKTEKEALAGRRPDPASLMEHNPLKAIVDLSIALKRLNGLHEKLSDAIAAAVPDSSIASDTGKAPQPDIEELLKWTQGAKFVYEEYIQYWRTDYDEVFINLDVLETIERKKAAAIGGAIGQIDSTGLMLNSSAAIGSDKTIDVGYLLKRPLVRTRVLMKLFKRVNYLQPGPISENAFSIFQALVATARRKVASERARVEDEAAACIDASRVRDLETLELCYGVFIDPNRRVRARDVFEMRFNHSRGKVLNRTVELYLRDEGKKVQGDDAELMICEVGDDGSVSGVEKKWLAFQPLPVRWVKARNSETPLEKPGEMILDVVAKLSDGSGWSERMLLETPDPMIKMEWLQLLGAGSEEVQKAGQALAAAEAGGNVGGLPVVKEDEVLPTPATAAPGPASPPNNSRTISGLSEKNKPIFAEIETQLKNLGFDEEYSEPPTPGLSVTSEIDRFPESDAALMNEGPRPGKPTVAVVVIPGLSDLYAGGPLAVPVYGELPHIVEITPHYVGKARIPSPPPSTISPLSSASYGPQRLQRRRTRHEVRRKEEEAKKQLDARKEREERERLKKKQQQQQQQKPATPPPTSPTKLKEETTPKAKRRSPTRLRSESPQGGKPASLSFKINSPPGSPGRSVVTEDSLSIEEASVLSWSDDSLAYGKQAGGYEFAEDIRRRSRSDSGSSDGSSSLTTSTMSARQNRAPARSRRSNSSSTISESEEEDAPPPVPLHKSSSQSSLRSTSSASSGSTVRDKPSRTSSPQPVKTSSSSSRGELKRRISSPLKHEYAPSSATQSEASLSDTDSSGTATEEEELSDDELSEVRPPKVEDEDGDIPGPMFASMITGRNMHSSGNKGVVNSTQYEELTSPRENGGFTRGHSQKNSVSGYSTTAFVFAWAPKGAWEKLQHDEVRVTLVDNFVEVYKQGEEDGSGRQLLNIEVTPVTPIRRGTAVDLTIKSGPFAKFQGGTVMFRSRTAQECEALYNAINIARINACNVNGFGGASGGAPSRKGSINRSGSVRGYRAASVDLSINSGSHPGEAGSIIMSESSSLGSLGSAFSAFKGSLRSSIFGGTKSSSGGSWMSSSSTSSALAGPRGIINAAGGIPITGIGGEAPYQGTGYVSNLKIKLWKRENATKWADLGPGRLNVITPPPGHAARGGGGLNANEKRIVVRDRKGERTLLDVVLGESCFERVARTGVALHVPFEDDGFVPELVRAGGGGRGGVFMLQFKGESEARETFRIIGKEKYAY